MKWIGYVVTRFLGNICCSATVGTDRTSPTRTAMKPMGGTKRSFQSQRVGMDTSLMMNCTRRCVRRFLKGHGSLHCSTHAVRVPCSTFRTYGSVVHFNVMVTEISQKEISYALLDVAMTKRVPRHRTRTSFSTTYQPVVSLVVPLPTRSRP
eukprot:PhF_6_TR40679/c1_g1_i1/m.61112